MFQTPQFNCTPSAFRANMPKASPNICKWHPDLEPQLSWLQIANVGTSLCDVSNALNQLPIFCTQGKHAKGMSLHLHSEPRLRTPIILVTDNKCRDIALRCLKRLESTPDFRTHCKHAKGMSLHLHSELRLRK